MRSKQLKLAHILAGRNPVNDRWSQNQSRSMTSSKRVQDRSRYKRVNDLEAVTERCKIAHKVIYLLEVLKQEPERVIPVKLLSADHRTKINLPKPHKISDFLRKSPKLFQLHRTRTGSLWCGLTELADELLREEETLLEAHSDKAAEIVTRVLMMTVEKRLELGKIAHFRRDFGLPIDFRSEWVNKYPDLFRLCSSSTGVRSLELIGWDPRLAVTELERRTTAKISDDSPGILRLGFPLKFPPNYLKAHKNKARIEEFQRLPYLSPYAVASGVLKPAPELRKRAVAVIHELLSFTLEKRLATTDHLTHFRRELLMPPKLMKLLLRHCGVFYVSERGTRFGVYLTEAYRGSELVEKHPLVLWKEKLHGFIGYRDRAKKPVPGFGYLSDMETEGLGLAGNEELEVGEVCEEYDN